MKRLNLRFIFVLAILLFCGSQNTRGEVPSGDGEGNRILTSLYLKVKVLGQMFLPSSSLQLENREDEAGQTDKDDSGLDSTSYEGIKSEMEETIASITKLMRVMVSMFASGISGHLSNEEEKIFDSGSGEMDKIKRIRDNYLSALQERKLSHEEVSHLKTLEITLLERGAAFTGVTVGIMRMTQEKMFFKFAKLICLSQLFSEYEAGFGKVIGDMEQFNLDLQRSRMDFHHHEIQARIDFKRKLDKITTEYQSLFDKIDTAKSQGKLSPAEVGVLWVVNIAKIGEQSQLYMQTLSQILTATLR